MESCGIKFFILQSTIQGPVLSPQLKTSRKLLIVEKQILIQILSNFFVALTWGCSQFKENWRLRGRQPPVRVTRGSTDTGKEKLFDFRFVF